MKLLDIPQDVLLRFLYELEVEEIVRIERSCRQLRRFILHDARHLWLLKLTELGPSCAPDIPPHVDVESLSGEELRCIVVEAMRLYCSMMNGPELMASYVLKKTIGPICETSGNIHLVRVSPDGRYVSMCWASGPLDTRHAYSHDELHIFDTENSIRCVWSYDPALRHENAVVVSVHSYGFDVQQDGSITFVAHTRGSSDGNLSSAVGLFQVYRLFLDPVAGTFQGTLVYSTESIGEPRIPGCTAVSGDFSAFLDRPNGIIIVFRLSERRIVRLTCSNRFTDTSRLQIWNDHLFYIDNTRQVVYAIPLAQIMSPADPQSSHVPELDVEQLSGSSLKLQEMLDENGCPLLRASRETRYSIFDTPWKKEPQAIFTFIAQAPTFFSQFVVVRFKFHRIGSGLWRWTLVSAVPPTEVDCGVLASPRSEMTRSGRLLLSVLRGVSVSLLLRELIPPDLGILAINQQGKPVVRCLPKNIAQAIHPLINQTGCHRKDDVEEYLEDYSGALVILRDTYTAQNRIEIYYPD